jgi:hypothetical protein
MQDDVDDSWSDEEASRRHGNLMSWPALLAVGWLLYEVTAQPNLGAAIVCVKFGWNDFRAAFWLRRMDSNRKRARACFWFYLASGLWKVAITATVTIFAFAFLAASLRPAQPRAAPPPRPDLPSWFAGVMLTALLGFGLSTIATGIALCLAARHGVRFWLSSSVHHYVRRNVWPPYDQYRFPTNHASLILLTALILVLAPVVITVCIGVAAAVGGGPLAALSVVLVIMGCGPVVVLMLRDIFDSRFVATTPWECWGREELDDPEWADSDQRYRPVPAD